MAYEITAIGNGSKAAEKRLTSKRYPSVKALASAISKEKVTSAVIINVSTYQSYILAKVEQRWVLE